MNPGGTLFSGVYALCCDTYMIHQYRSAPQGEATNTNYFHYCNVRMEAPWRDSMAG